MSTEAGGCLRPDAIAEDIQRVADELGHPPTVSMYRKHGEYSDGGVASHYGTWNEALEAAGFEPNPATNGPIPEEELLADLVRVAADLEKKPTASDYETHGEYCETTLRRRFREGFGSLALEAYEISQAFDGFHLEHVGDSK